MTKKRAKDDTFAKMVQFIMAIGKTVCSLEEEKNFIRMETLDMKANMSMEEGKEKENIFGETGIIMKDIKKMI